MTLDEALEPETIMEQPSELPSAHFIAYLLDMVESHHIDFIDTHLTIRYWQGEDGIEKIRQLLDYEAVMGFKDEFLEATHHPDNQMIVSSVQATPKEA